MSLLTSVTTGKQIGAQIHTIVGNNGVGKTTWAASFPKPLLLDLENGSLHLDVTRITADQIPILDTFRQILKDLITTKHDYLTLVIDSVEALEGLISDGVCAEGKVASIELYEGGYGKGFTRTREIMRDIFGDLRELQKRGMTIILVAHAQVKSHSDPVSNQTYDRVIMRCNDKMAALIRDLSDNVFFATYKVFTTKEKGKTKAFGDGQRVIFTQWRPGFDAKNRLELPLELPLSYDSFIEACTQAAVVNPDTVLSDINEMSEKLDDPLKAKVKEQIEKYKNDIVKLRDIKNRLMKYVS